MKRSERSCYGCVKHEAISTLGYLRNELEENSDVRTATAAQLKEIKNQTEAWFQAYEASLLARTTQRSILNEIAAVLLVQAANEVMTTGRAGSLGKAPERGY